MWKPGLTFDKANKMRAQDSASAEKDHRRDPRSELPGRPEVLDLVLGGLIAGNMGVEWLLDRLEAGQ